MIHMTGMSSQIATGFVKLIIKLEVQMMSLKVHYEKNRRHCAREFTEGVKHVLGLQGYAFLEFRTVDLGR